jgi:hypothetical protein
MAVADHRGKGAGSPTCWMTSRERGMPGERRHSQPSGPGVAQGEVEPSPAPGPGSLRSRAALGRRKFAAGDEDMRRPRCRGHRGHRRGQLHGGDATSNRCLIQITAACGRRSHRMSSPDCSRWER